MEGFTAWLTGRVTDKSDPKVPKDAYGNAFAFMPCRLLQGFRDTGA